MRWPKRFRLHEAASAKTGDLHQTDVIQVLGNRLVAVDGVGAAFVPLLAHDERPGADLPRLAPGESVPLGLLPLKAVQEAAQGTQGEGLLQAFPHTVEAQRGDGKPWLRFERPEPDPIRELPPVEALQRIMAGPVPEGSQMIEVMFDAEALVRLSRAVGAGPRGVRLRFLANEAGRCAAQGAHGMIEVTPVDELQGGGHAILAAVVVDQ